MPPYQQTYDETFEIEKANRDRDINILNQISNNKYIFLEAQEKELQYEGVDFIGIPKDAPVDTWKYVFIDRKTSNKYDKRDWFIFELYYQYEDGAKKESWSLKEPNSKNLFMIVFIDREQVISIGKRDMINSLGALEELRPDLIKITEESNNKGKPVKKYIVSLHKNNIFFKNMNPNIYEKYVIDGEEVFLKNN